MAFRLSAFLPRLVSNALDIYGKTRVDMALTTAASASAALPEGRYAVWATEDAYIQVDPVGDSIPFGYKIWKDSRVDVLVGRDHKIIAKTVSAVSAILSYHAI